MDGRVGLMGGGDEVAEKKTEEDEVMRIAPPAKAEVGGYDEWDRYLVHRIQDSSQCTPSDPRTSTTKMRRNRLKCPHPSRHLGLFLVDESSMHMAVWSLPSPTLSQCPLDSQEPRRPIVASSMKLGHTTQP